MNRRATITTVAAGLLVLSSAAANAAPPTDEQAGSGQFQFTPITNEVPCGPSTPDRQPFVLPPGYAQTVIASQPSYPDVPDMQTLNETGPEAGRYLYRTHETNSNGALSVTDLETGQTTVLAQRPDWERFDGIVWTPWGTLLAAEETNAAAFPDPEVPQAKAGLVYEYFLDPHDPTKLDTSVNPTGLTPGVVPRPALGSKSHEGMRIDPQGNLYSISENASGHIFRFVPDRRNDYSSGQLYSLNVTVPTGDRTGEAAWVPLDRTSVQVDANVTAAPTTSYNRPEDVELATSTGNNNGGPGANTLYVSVTQTPGEARVLGIDLREPAGGAAHSTAFVYDYVRAGVNAPDVPNVNEFEWPDNLALDHSGNLFIAEDKPENELTPAGSTGDDVWVAQAQPGRPDQPAVSVVRFAALKECGPEPTGIYFDNNGGVLYADVQHRGAPDDQDLTMAITPPKG